MSPSKPLLSVIIPHLNQLGQLELCLTSLENQTLERSRFEIIVVDNGSSTLPEGVVARHPGVQLLQELRPGPGFARNCGVQAAVGDVLCFTDADCRADPRWLRSAVEALYSAPERTILGGDVRIWRNDKVPTTALEAYESVFAYRFKLYIEQHGFCGTGNLVVWRADFTKVGPFEGIHLAEDVEWGRRARAAGFNFCYVPEMIVFHPARSTMHELYVKWDRHIQHDFNIARKGQAWTIRWLARAFAIILSPIIDSAKIFTSDRIDGGAARFKALLVLIAVRVYRSWRMLSLLWSSRGIMWNRETEVGFSDRKK